MKNNTTNSIPEVNLIPEVKPEIKKGIFESMTEIKKPSCLKDTFLRTGSGSGEWYKLENSLDLIPVNKDEKVIFAFQSKGKLIAGLSNDNMAGYRVFPATTGIIGKEIREYLRFDYAKMKVATNQDGQKLIDAMSSMFCGSDSKFGTEFLACKSLTGKNGRTVSKVNQKAISSKLFEV